MECLTLNGLYVWKNDVIRQEAEALWRVRSGREIKGTRSQDNYV